MAVVVVAVVVALAAAAFFFMQRNKGQDGSTDAGVGGTTAATPSASKRNWLVGTGGEVQGKVFHVGERIVSIGRKPANFIQINDSDSSRVHCNIKPTAQGLMITDMTSRNGTFVNEKRIVGPVEVREGDSIRIGAASFRFHRDGDFDRNDAMGRKAADASAHAATSAAEGLDGLISRALRDTNGNVYEAARRLQVPPQIVQTFLDRRE